MRNKNLKIIKELIKLNGDDSTFDKVAEECVELALAIMQLKCPTKLDKRKGLMMFTLKLLMLKYK